MKLWHVLVFCVVWMGGLLIYRFRPEPHISHPPGILVPEEPEQHLLHQTRMWQHKNYWISPLATFKLRARVLHKKRYDFGREADLSPVDLALGWGPMSDQAVLEHLTISQATRRYFVRSKTPPLPLRTIFRFSSNMHMIPATPDIAQTLAEVRVGEIIVLQGYLVAVRSNDGWRWRSSLSRDDTGDGACELVWVERLAIQP
ncbi:MAG: hypothetical protein ONB48_13715 [candidate division KSB1 bacterium]|nr:hypothetical protein [candidate division KSB1 bacterium]MDZ7276512.1 hypothetical protein [candidate division KSB1 bacterium]MDZ7286707.1 hypothetical protein [candidate division KSB1 bacterium]MDZ7300282.1 hypothetical protein [candidate division KSB1 bacterium]MDZ7307883.1 hypothetical protein [candidate division KSB1 bacterium]